MRDQNDNFDEKTKTTPGAGRRREDGQPPPAESGETSKVRNIKQTAH